MLHFEVEPRGTATSDYQTKVVREPFLGVNNVRSVYPKDRINGVIDKIDGGSLRHTHKTKAHD